MKPRVSHHQNVFRLFLNALTSEVFFYFVIWISKVRDRNLNLKGLLTIFGISSFLLNQLLRCFLCPFFILMNRFFLCLFF